MHKAIFAFLASASAVAATVSPGVAFIENKGQIAAADGKPAAGVYFKATGIDPGIFVTDKGLTYVFYKREADPQTRQTKSLSWSRIDMSLKGARISDEKMTKEGALGGTSNFYYAHCPNGVVTVQSWQKITFHDVYPGIDWVLKADAEEGLAYDFVVHPGADLSAIRIVYSGAEQLQLIDKNTRVLLKSAYGEMYEGALRVFQQDGEEVNAQFVRKGNEVSFDIRDRNPQYQLIIDPPLQWSKKLASSGYDYGTSIAAPRDGSGDVIVTGFAGSTDFPTANAYQGTNAGNDDIVVTRLNSAGNILWSTYYGGSGLEGGKGIAADADGNCYVAGYTSSTNFPTLNALYATFQGGTNDVALLKLDSAGIRQWATYYGGLSNDYGNALVCDFSGNCYITGYTNSTNFPVLNAIQSVKGNVYDAFAIKLNDTCAVQWATYLGGNDEDRGRGITLDPAGSNVFITGTTVGQFSVTTGAFQLNHASLFTAEDGFVMKLSAGNATLQYSTFLGGADADFPEDIAVDNAGNAYVTGYTFSSDFPVANPGAGAYVDSSLATLATHDAFITKLNAMGTAAPWSSYLGGTSVDMAFGICYDVFTGIYIVGGTTSTDFPLQQPVDMTYYQSMHGDAGVFLDYFVTWFNTSGVLQWSTFFGNANGNEAKAVDTDAQSNIFVCGTDSDNVHVVKFAAAQTTGVISDLQAERLKVYPVPAGLELTLSLAVIRPGTVLVEVYSSDGALVRREEIAVSGSAAKHTLDVTALPAGSYLLKCRDAEKSSVAKFTKSN